MRYISVCSGIEAASVAWDGLGWEPVAFAEIDPFPCAVLKSRYPDIPNLGDISQVDWRPYCGKVDLVVGGTPCQSFSIAGKREGLDGASGLVREYFRLLSEVCPRWFVWENVPGALSSGRNKGDDFRFILQRWDDLGYSVAWRVLDAQYYGVAQRRRRLFAVGYLGDWRNPIKVLFEPEGMPGDTEKSGYTREKATKTTGRKPSECAGVNDRVFPTLMANAGSKLWLGNQEAFSGRYFIYERPATTLRDRNGKPGGGKGPLLSEEVSLTLATSNDQILFAENMGGYVPRRLTPTECERLQGFPDGWTRIPYKGKPAEECPDGPRYKALGNSMAVPCMRWIGERIQAVEDDLK